MPKLKWVLILTGGFLVGGMMLAPSSHSEEPFIYNIYKALDLGNPGETPQKDYYINLGKSHGLKNGALLEVYRRLPSYDIRNEKLFQDVTVPLATLKVIHTEQNVSIARLEKMHSPEKTASLTPSQILVGDLVRKAIP